MAKKKDPEAEEIVKGDWKLAEGSDGPFKASYCRVAFNPYHFGPVGDADFMIELLFDDGTEKKPMPFYMNWWKHKAPPNVEDIIAFLVNTIIPVGASEEARTLKGAPGNGWERWFYVRHCLRLTTEFKALIGADMFSAIAPAPEPANVNSAK